MDVDWQKAAPIVTGIPFGQLLVTVHNIGRIADIQNHRGRRLHNIEAVRLGTWVCDTKSPAPAIMD